MLDLSPAAIAHAKVCASLDAATTSEFAAAALNLSLDTARSTLRKLVAAGYLRVSILRGFGNEIIYQPTPRAAGWRGKNPPKHLRSGASQSSLFRAWQRGALRFIHRPDLSYLDTKEQTSLCRVHGVPERGYARAQVGMDGAGQCQVFIPILPAEGAYSALVALARWGLLLDMMPSSRLHFVVSGAASAESIRRALADELDDADAAVELADLEVEVAEDRTGTAVVRLAGRMAALRDRPIPPLSRYLGGIIEV